MQRHKTFLLIGCFSMLMVVFATQPFEAKAFFIQEQEAQEEKEDRRNRDDARERKENERRAEGEMKRGERGNRSDADSLDRRARGDRSRPDSLDRAERREGRDGEERNARGDRESRENPRDVRGSDRTPEQLMEQLAVARSQELERHEKRMAHIESIIKLAQEDSNDSALQRAETLMAKETSRHEKKMSKLDVMDARLKQRMTGEGEMERLNERREGVPEKETIDQ